MLSTQCAFEHSLKLTNSQPFSRHIEPSIFHQVQSMIAHVDRARDIQLGLSAPNTVNCVESSLFPGTILWKTYNVHGKDEDMPATRTDTNG
jgi:hypothetical protein